jgi:saccharopepsin
LGLAPHANNGQNNPYFPADLDDPFLSMVSKELLDKNVFGLKLSRGMDDPGEIMFGGVNTELFEGELRTMPLLNNSGDRRLMRGRWNIPAISMSLGPGSASLEGYAASLESDFPFIGLPLDFRFFLYEYLGMEQKGDTVGPYPVPFSIDSSKRVELEDFTLTLGGHDFVITPYEYTIEMDAEEWSGHRCISAIVPVQDFGEKFIMVGSSFLRAFYSVFDLDERTVSCEWLSTFSLPA